MKTLKIIFLSVFAMTLFAFNSSAQIVVKHKLKAPKVIKEKPAKPNDAAVWVLAEWKFNKTTKKYIWKKGHWIVPRANSIWIPGKWQKVPKGYKWLHGQWKVTPNRD